MSPILGNIIALLLVAGLVSVCVRTLWRDHKQGCASCGSVCGGNCAGCAGCSAGTGGGSSDGGFRPGGKLAYNGKLYHIDADALRVKRDQ